AEARKEIGGSAPVTGKCFAEDGTMVFLVAKPAVPTLAAAVKKVAKRETGLSLDPEFRVASDADADEVGDTAVGQAEATTPPTAPAGPDAGATPAPSQVNVLGLQKALQKLGFYAGALDAVMGPPTQDAVKRFQTANGLPADGIVNPITQAALANALKGQPAT